MSFRAARNSDLPGGARDYCFAGGHKKPCANWAAPLSGKESPGTCHRLYAILKDVSAALRSQAAARLEDLRHVDPHEDSSAHSEDDNTEDSGDNLKEATDRGFPDYLRIKVD